MKNNKIEAAMAAFAMFMLFGALIYPIVAFWSCSARLSC